MRWMWRKAWHLLGLAFPLAYYFGNVPKLWVLVACGAAAALAATFDFLRLNYPRAARPAVALFGPLLREREQKGFNSSWPYLVGAFLTILIFPKVIAFAALLNLGLGDTAAEFMGRFFGRVRIFHGKTLEGTAGCAAACFLAAWYFVGWPVALAGAVIAAAAELFSPGQSDNFIIPLASGAAMWLVSLFAGLPLS